MVKPITLDDDEPIHEGPTERKLVWVEGKDGRWTQQPKEVAIATAVPTAPPSNPYVDVCEVCGERAQYQGSCIGKRTIKVCFIHRERLWRV